MSIMPPHLGDGWASKIYKRYCMPVEDFKATGPQVAVELTIFDPAWTSRRTNDELGTNAFSKQEKLGSLNTSTIRA